MRLAQLSLVGLTCLGRPRHSIGPLYVFNLFAFQKLKKKDMFVVVPITDLVVIKPKKFGLDIQKVITSDLNSRFSNKVSRFIYIIV